MNPPVIYKIRVVFIMPVRCSFYDFKIVKTLMITAYVIGSINISQKPIKQSYKEIYKLADTRKQEKLEYETHITHAITTLWTLPIIPSILILYPPYYAVKKTKEYLNNNERV
jgi:hypothetical protein